MAIPSDFQPLGYSGHHFSVGSMVVYGANNWCNAFNLNEKTNCDYLFQGCYDLTIPNGITFANCKRAEYAFQNTQNLVLPEGVTFENMTDAYGLFQGAKNPHFPSSLRFGKLTQGRFMFEKAVINETIELIFDDPFDCYCLMAGATWNGYLPNATFENVPTQCSQIFNASKPLNSSIDTIQLPKATFAKTTTSFGNIFWDLSKWKRVDMPEASFASITTGGTTYATSNKKFKIPKVTWEKLTTSFNKKTYPNKYIFPMLRLNLKSLTDGTGMFHGDGMDVDTLETIALGPVDMRDDTSGIKKFTDGSAHTITLGIDVALKPEYENPDSTLGAKVRAALSEIEQRGWTLDLEWNVPTSWD